jgi:hypothetical protein
MSGEEKGGGVGKIVPCMLERERLVVKLQAAAKGSILGDAAFLHLHRQQAFVFTLLI